MTQTLRQNGLLRQGAQPRDRPLYYKLDAAAIEAKVKQLLQAPKGVIKSV
jgi:hypothetical protein